MELDLKLGERKVDTKDKKITKIIIYQVESIKKHYDENMELINKQFPIAEQLLLEGNVDAAKTIWRTQIVLLSSAFDYFMHEIVWYGLDKIYDGDWDSTEQYANLSIRLGMLKTVIQDLDNKEWFVDFITEKYKKQTLMSYGDVKDHLNLIGISVKAVADDAFYKRGCKTPTNKQMKTKLEKLYSRRNQIAHQSDRSERNAEREDITREQVDNFIKDVDKIVTSLIKEIKEKSV